MGTAQASRTTMVLNSWKEIAAYLGRGVRTVQRYERDLGLPVRRPRGKSRSAVIALTDELDAWLRNAPRNELDRLDKDDNGNGVVQFKGEIHNLRATQSLRELRERSRKLREENASLTVNLMRSLQVTRQLVTWARTTRAAGGGTFPKLLAQ